MDIETLAKEFGEFKTATLAEVDALKAENGRLKTHSARLLKDLKKAKVKIKTPDMDGDELDDSDEDGDDAPAGNGKADPDLRRVQKEHADELARLKKELDDTKAARSKAAIDAALGEALGKANIAPGFRTAVNAMFRAGRKIEAGADGVVTVDGKPVVDMVAEWASTDEGRAFVSAPASGGSAAPPTGPSGAPSKARSAMTRAEKASYIDKHGQDAYLKLPR